MENVPLILDLLEWLEGEPKPYDDVMQVWRTSCPRLTIWEDAVDAGLVSVQRRRVFLTDTGWGFLRARRDRAKDEGTR
jgi:hypothetical protein